MSADADAYRALVQAEIAHHLQVFGPKNWEEVQKRHPSVTPRTFFRWVKAVRENKADVDPIPLATKRARVESLKHLPAPPSPEYLAREGARAGRQIDFLTALGELYEEAEELAAFARHPPKEGQKRGAIKNPILADQSVKRRLDVIREAMATMREVYDLKRQREFYDLIVEEIAKVAPDVSAVILERLAALNAKHGLTIHAGEV